MSDSLARKKSSSGKSAEEPQNSAYDSLLKSMKQHRNTLQIIVNELDPFSFLSKDGTSIRITNVIVQKFQKDIKKIFEFLKSNMSDIDKFKFVTNTRSLCKKLEDIYSILDLALLSWDRSKSSGQTERQISDAERNYKDILKDDCRTLLEEAIALILVE